MNYRFDLPINFLPDPLDGRLRRLFGNDSDEAWRQSIRAHLMIGHLLGQEARFAWGLTWERGASGFSGGFSYQWLSEDPEVEKQLTLAARVSGLVDFLQVFSGIEQDKIKKKAKKSGAPGAADQERMIASVRGMKGFASTLKRSGNFGAGVEITRSVTCWPITYDPQVGLEHPLNEPRTTREIEPEKNPWQVLDSIFRASETGSAIRISVCADAADYGGGQRLQDKYSAYLKTVLDKARAATGMRFSSGVDDENPGFYAKSEELVRELRRELETTWRDLRGKPHFLSSIRVFAGDPNMARMVAAKVGEQLFGAGNYAIRPIEKQKLPDWADPLFRDNSRAVLPSELGTGTGRASHGLLKFSRDTLTRLIPLDTMVDWFTLPQVSDRYYQSVPTSTDPKPKDGEAQAKSVLKAFDLDRHRPVQMAARSLTRHLFVTGMTGSGKTTTVHHLLMELWEQGIPFLVIEPAKTEYRRLKFASEKLKKDLNIYTPGSETVEKLKLNLLRPLDRKAPIQEHISMLMSVLKSALPMPAPLPFLLMEALEEVYKNHSKFVANTGREKVHKIEELLDAMRKVMSEKRYAPEIRNNIETMLETRFGALTRGYIGEVLKLSNNSPSIDDLLDKPAIVELGALNRDEANLLTLFLLNTIWKFRKKQGGHKPLRHVIVLEEAHNLMESASAGGGDQELSFDPRQEASRNIEQMLAEVRALGQGIIIADQSPSAVPVSVVRNTRTKIVHQINDPDDRAYMARALGLSDEKEEDMAHLIPEQGEAFFSSDGYVRPTRISVNFSEQYGKTDDHYDDEKVKELKI